MGRCERCEKLQALHDADTRTNEGLVLANLAHKDDIKRLEADVTRLRRGYVELQDRLDDLLAWKEAVGCRCEPQDGEWATCPACDRDKAQQQVAVLAEAVGYALSELGVPGPDYPQPIANAVERLREAMDGVPQ